MDKRIRCESRGEIVDVDSVEAEAIFDRLARRRMGISGAEFLRRYDAGVYSGKDMDDVPGLVDVWMALPLVR